MENLGERIIAMHRDKLADLHRRAAAAIAQLGDDDVNWRPNAESNSIANLVIHMAGNIGQRFTHGIGGAPDVRNRDAEFNDRTPLTREQALARLEAAFKEAERVMAGLTPERLHDPVPVRNQQWDVLQVIGNAATHLSEHVGQIMYIAKLRLGPGYQVLQSPHRKA